MSLEQLFESLPILCKEPSRLWEAIESTFRKGFFDQVVFKKYANLFDEKAENNYLKIIQEIRKEVANELKQLKKHYEKILDNEN